MFWKFLLAAVLAVALLQLGAMSVWVVVPKAAFFSVLAVALFAGLLRDVAAAQPITYP